jgi:uncharacterized 2Fe-2S/4Fe-4S cluster protein (DUF4445 family)
MKEKEKATVIFQPSGRRGQVEKGKNLKEASIALGVDIEGLCGEQGVCGKCKVRVEKGFFEKYGVESCLESLTPLTDTERDSLTVSECAQGFRLACMAEVLSDVVVFVPEESRLGKQVVRKAGRRIDIALKPAVKEYSVELPKPSLEDTLGDWERLQDGLRKSHGVESSTIDYHALLELQNTLRRGDWKATVTVWMGKELIRIREGQAEKAYGVAVDVGTTTVAAYLCDLRTGELIWTSSMMNPQVTYGEDVMSRISYTLTNPEGLGQLHRTIIDGLNGLLEDLAREAGIQPEEIVDMVIVGNTCMHHLLLGIDPRHIGKAPFPPAIHHSVDIKARDLGVKICPGAYLHVLPIEAGFVGADNVGVLISETPYNEEKVRLIIDIGTNGELILGNRDKLISSSCATGPAFEGAEIKHGMRAAPGAIEKIVIDKQSKEVRFKVIDKEAWSNEMENIGAKGICGSGIIDVLPQLFLAGVIDRTGRFAKDVETPRYRVTEEGPAFVIAWARETSIGQDIVITQDDIRAVQLAKGAMYAGAKIMMRAFGVDRVDEVILAGAFGSYIDKTSAAMLGLFPDCPIENIRSVGNAAGDGARMALLNLDKRSEANEWARQVEYLELTLEEDFEKRFAQAMWLPHMKDKFPSLEHLLPGKGDGKS